MNKTIYVDLIKLSKKEYFLEITNLSYRTDKMIVWTDEEFWKQTDCIIEFKNK